MTLETWRCTGGKIPPTVRLLRAAKLSYVPALKADRLFVTNLPSPEPVDGLLQNPTPAPFLARRMGPTSVVIDDEKLPSLQKALKDLGIELQA
jgi:hypothetical protein